MPRPVRLNLGAAILMTGLAGLLTGCVVEEEQRIDDERFPLEPHLIFPIWWPSNGQIATGVVTGQDGALEQPIAFSHYLHAYKSEIQCEYCHSSARRSIHGGVPELSVCMNCHKHVKKDAPEIKKIKAAFDAGTPIEWNKVHDLPDYVNFAHNRHVRAGVNCVECHGQVQLQGEPRIVTVDDGGKQVPSIEVDTVMIREASLQMGWCLDCHAEHPSVDENYGEKAQLRRSELKDCWTCHK